MATLVEAENSEGNLAELYPSLSKLLSKKFSRITLKHFADDF